MATLSKKKNSVLTVALANGNFTVFVRPIQAEIIGYAAISITSVSVLLRY